MKHELRSTWIYVAVPVALVVIAVVILALAPDDPAAPFDY